MALQEKVQRHVGWLGDGSMLLAAVWTFWVQAIYSSGSFQRIALMIVWLPITLLWVGRVLQVVLNISPPQRRHRLRYYGLLPLLAVLLVAISFTNWPMQTVFWLHQPFLHRMATRILSTQDAKERARLSQPQRVGLYWASQIETVPGGIRFIVSDSGFLNGDYLGFAYYPSGDFSEKPWSSSSVNTYSGPERINAHWFRWRKIVPWD